MAADVDEQRGVVDDRSLLLVEPDPLGEPQRDQALAQHVLHRLAEAEVDAERQRRDELRQPDRARSPSLATLVSMRKHDRASPNDGPAPRQLTQTVAVGFSGAVAEFTAAVENYDRFMGRYATGLAPKFADAAGVRAGMRVIDVGCGPGALAVELAGRVGEDNVAAIDPAPQFAAACRARIPGADVREGVAESLPWEDGSFDAAMCSLVVAWMSDADQGIGEMARVTKPGGTVAAAMWDIPGGGLQMLSHFWRAAREIDPSSAAERPRHGVGEGSLVERFGRAGLEGVTGGTLETSVDYADFDDYWEPFTGAAGTATSAFYASLDAAGKATLRHDVRACLPEGDFAHPGARLARAGNRSGLAGAKQARRRLTRGGRSAGTTRE